MDVRSLSRTEAKVVLWLEAQGKELVTLDELRSSSRTSSGFSRKLAHTLVKKGWLQRVRRGTYLLNPSRHGPDLIPDVDPLRFGSHLVRPYYFGYATAAELHGLLPQAGRVYYLVTPVRLAGREFGPSTFRVVHVRRDHLFGVEAMARRGRELIVSDLERTVLDCAARPGLSGGMGGVSHILAVAKPRITWSRLVAYLNRLDNESLARRVGYLLERVRPSVRLPARVPRALLPRSRSSPFVPVAPPHTHGRQGPHDPRWRVVRNVSDAELFSEGELT